MRHETKSDDQCFFQVNHLLLSKSLVKTLGGLTFGRQIDFWLGRNDFELGRNDRYSTVARLRTYRALVENASQ